MKQLITGSKTKHWHTLPDGRVQCDVCPRACKLHEGQRGFCFVRACSGSEIVLTTYGRSSGYCIDPIEKKPLNHFLPGTPVLSFGTAGCNLGCKFCQNWDISTSREWDKLSDQAMPERIAQAAVDTNCRSVAFTYNDPVIFMEYAIDTAKACHERDVRSVAVTAGYITPAARGEFFHHMDAVNVDLKAFSESFYQKICGAHLEDIKDTLLYIHKETNCWMEVTTLLIPGENDSNDELDAMSDWFANALGPDVPWHFSAFHPDFKMMNTPRTPEETLLRARAMALSKGLHYVYVGNVHNEEADSSYCPNCAQRIIGRNWYVMTDWQMDAVGCCASCNTPIPGVFEARPGNWGSKRQAIHLH